MNLFISSYKKYNKGDLSGTWLSVEDYADKDEFLDACKDLLQETDPEIMFQDSEDVPLAFISESYIAPELWEYLELDEADRSIVSIALEHGWCIISDIFKDVIDNVIVYSGRDARIDSYIESAGEVPAWLEYHIDRDSIWRELDIACTFFEGDCGKIYEYLN